MPLTDFGPDELDSYRPESPAPKDFDAFWQRTLAEARSYDGTVKTERVTSAHLLRTVDVDDVHFPGCQRIGVGRDPARGGLPPLATGRQDLGTAAVRGARTVAVSRTGPSTALRGPALGCCGRPSPWSTPTGWREIPRTKDEAFTKTLEWRSLSVAELGAGLGQGSDLRVELEERHELRPGVLAKRHDRRIFGAPLLWEIQEAVLPKLRAFAAADVRLRGLHVRVRALTKTAALEPGAYKIGVNAVHPGRPARR
uniref:acetylxylan esterase n=1 Tax=Streptomyces himalayensis TaxID=2820085 RepID=UPI001FE832D6|nr:acetylxylan esterase [Streptomyces himalayensis]